ncbi:lytic murein transglycosylase [Micromonospora sp. CPCC 205371]|nr:lytic murein transglycosylase [Micromonospora sp. CPCC 205371]
MRNTRRVADGEATPERRLRSATPEWAGPLGSSGAAPDSAPKAPEPPPEPVEAVKPEAVKPEAEPVKVAAATEATPATDVLQVGPPPSRTRPRSAPPRPRAPRPRQAASAPRAWAARPSGRITLPGLLLAALVGIGAASGAVLIPATATDRVSGTATPTPEATESLAPDAGGPIGTGGPYTPYPTGTATPTTGTGSGTTSGRPADVLANWASQAASKVDVPLVAMQAYGYAELVVAQTNPSCNLKWTTLAAIGKVESNHGRFNATLSNNGQSLPRILGPPLNGQGGTQRILDTDQGELDGDPTYDKAVGPMQFIPTTWRQHAIDADNDQAKDPNDIDDAALAAGNYLCQGGRDLSNGQDWWNAILSYNDVRPYAQSVFDAANDYGAKSRT